MIDNDLITHVYCMPGMSAGPNIFENLRLPPEKYQIHLLSWKQPKKEESIKAYAQRMVSEVKHKKVILLGVSLGGVVVQEMVNFMDVEKLVLISTVKTNQELPGFMKFGKKTGLYKLLPLGWIKYYPFLERLPIGRRIKTRLKLYDRYIAVVNKAYLRWSVREILNWDREEPIPGVIHIHGDKDRLFPIKYIENCVVLPGGSHIMIINRFRWFNQNLPLLLEGSALPTQK